MGGLLANDFLVARLPLVERRWIRRCLVRESKSTTSLWTLLLAQIKRPVNWRLVAHLDSVEFELGVGLLRRCSLLLFGPLLSSGLRV